jgi:hypothetical protein
MIRTFAILLGLGAAASAFIIPRHGSIASNRVPVVKTGSPVVLELYQSQGCSSCPPALEVLRQEANRPDVIALSFAVTYWDQLGWKDRFARPSFTERQWDYARANGRGNVATPQMIVNGRGFVNGGDKAEVDAAIRQFAAVTQSPTLKMERGRLIIGASATPTAATVWLVSYDPRTIEVPIRAGENSGRTLPHRNIVRSIASLGSWNGSAQTYALPSARPALVRVILLQSGKGGPIIAARALGDHLCWSELRCRKAVLAT